MSHRIHIISQDLTANPIKKMGSLVRRKKLGAAAALSTILFTAVLTMFSATAVNADVAKADILGDLLCMDAESGDVIGKWSDNDNLFRSLGGRTSHTMPLVTKSTDPYEKGTQDLTAFQKYGAQLPIFEAWLPAFTDNADFTFKGVNPSTYGIGTTGVDPGTNAGSVPIEVSDGKFLTGDVFACKATDKLVQAEIANLIAGVPRMAVQFSTVFYENTLLPLSDDRAILHPVLETVDDLVAGKGGLKDSLFLPFLVPLVLVGAVVLAYRGIVKRQSLSAVQGAIYMTAAVALGTFLLSSPAQLVEGISYPVQQVQKVISTAPLPGADDEMCAAGNQAAASQKTALCQIWKTSLYQPWVAGQFGADVSVLKAATADAEQERSRNILTRDPREVLTEKVNFGSRSVAAGDWALFMLDRQEGGKALQISEVAYAQLSGAENIPGAVNQTWAGGNAQIVNAGLMWLTTPVSTLPLLISGVLLLLYQLLFVMLILASPLVFALGIIPGFGKGVMLRIAELALSTIIKALVVQLVLTIWFVLFGIVVVAGVPLLPQAALLTVIGIGFFLLRAQLGKVLRINLPGSDKRFGLPAMKQLAGVAGVAGGIGGLMTGGLVGAFFGNRMAKGMAEGATEEFKPGESQGAPVQAVKPHGSRVLDAAAKEGIRQMGQLHSSPSKPANGASGSSNASSTTKPVMEHTEPEKTHSETASRPFPKQGESNSAPVQPVIRKALATGTSVAVSAVGTPIAGAVAGAAVDASLGAVEKAGSGAENWGRKIGG